jgi:hypothetical protein
MFAFRLLPLDVDLNADAMWTSAPAKAFFDACPKTRTSLLAIPEARSSKNMPDHRHRRLLRTRREWPSGRAAEQRNEITPFHPIELHPMPLAAEAA